MLSSSFTLNEQNNSNNLINSSTKNEQQKLEDLTKEDIIEKLNDKKKKIIEYYDMNKSLKKELTKILEKLNNLSTNYLIEFYPSQNNLQIKLNNKKKEYLKNKTNNSMLKMEYNILIKKSREISAKKLSNIMTEKRIFVDKIKQENFEINKEIKKKEIESAQTQNEVINMTKNNIYIHNLDLYSYKLKKVLDNKNKYIKAFNTTKKMINEKMKEVNNLENNIKIKHNIYSKNASAFNKIKEDLNKIKTDLIEVTEELNKKNINDNILILNNISQKNEITTNTNVTNNYPTNNQINIYIEKRSVKNHKSVNNCYTMISESKSKNKVKLKPILYKSKSTSLIKNKKMNNNSLNSEINNYNLNFNKKKAYFRNKYTTNEISTNSSVTMNNCLSNELSKIKFIDTDDNAYQVLLNKKENYLEESERLSKNINQAHRTFAFKNTKMLHHLQINIKELNDIKIANNELQEEIKKLQEIIKKLKADNKKNMENGLSVKKEKI